MNPNPQDQNLLCCRYTTAPRKWRRRNARFRSVRSLRFSGSKANMERKTRRINHNAEWNGAALPADKANAVNLVLLSLCQGIKKAGGIPRRKVAE